MRAFLMGLTDGLARVTDVNGRWEATLVLDRGPVESIVCDPRHPERVYACAGTNGFWRSDDAGATWQQAGEGIAHPVLWTAAVSGSEEGSDGNVVYVGTQLSALYRSEDGGRSFRELASFQTIPSRPEWATPPHPDTHHVCSMVADPPGGEGVLLVGIELAGVVRSLDRGETWEDVHPIADKDPHSMLAHPLAPGRLYISGGVSYCESPDYGKNWTRVVDGFDVCYFDKLAVDPGDPDTMVISAAREPLTGHGVLPPKPSWSTLYRRSNGSGWMEVTDGLPPREGTAMGFLGTNDAEPGVFYYTTLSGEMYRSGDGGEHWEDQRVAWTGGAPYVQTFACLEA